jgi:hypothetical protein
MVTAILERTAELAAQRVYGATLSEVRLSAMLDECLTDMENGHRDVERLAGRFPEAVEEIEELLEIASMLRTQARAARRATY